MKQFLLLLSTIVLFFTSIDLKAQVTIGNDATPVAGAVLDLGQVPSNNKGLMLPKVSLPNLSTWAPILGTPMDGMFVYNTNATTGTGVYYWEQSKWNWVKSATVNNTDWLLNGNTNGVLKTLGTKDAFDLPFIVNNIERLRLEARSDTSVIRLAMARPTELTFGNYASQNVNSPHIILYESGDGLYGFGVTSSQLNYITSYDHVFYSDGAVPREQFRIQAGNNTNKSSLKIANVPQGNETDNILVIRNNEVYQKAPQSSPGVVTAKLVGVAKVRTEVSDPARLGVFFDSEMLDPENKMEGSVSTGTVYTVAKTALHQIFVNLSCVNKTVGKGWYLRIKKNGTPIAAMDATATDGGGASAVVFAIDTFNEGDKITVDRGGASSGWQDELTRIAIFRFE